MQELPRFVDKTISHRLEISRVSEDKENEQSETELPILFHSASLSTLFFYVEANAKIYKRNQ